MRCKVHLELICGSKENRRLTREENQIILKLLTKWKQARDLALLAIASYTGKSKDGKSEISEQVQEKSISEAEEGFEMSPMD